MFYNQESPIHVTESTQLDATVSPLLSFLIMTLSLALVSRCIVTLSFKEFTQAAFLPEMIPCFYMQDGCRMEPDTITINTGQLFYFGFPNL